MADASFDLRAVSNTDFDSGASREAGRPVLMVVDAESDAREAIREALDRRFGDDYQIAMADSAESGLATLQQLAEAGAQVALLMVDGQLPGVDAIDFIAQ